MAQGLFFLFQPTQCTYQTRSTSVCHMGILTPINGQHKRVKLSSECSSPRLAPVRSFWFRRSDHSLPSLLLARVSATSCDTLAPYAAFSIMSDIPRLTKKQKKAAAFRDKKGKGKAKHRSEETSHDIPVEENQDLEELSTGFGVSTNAVAEDKISANHIVVEDATAVIGDSGPSKKRKRGDITIEPTGPVAGETQPSAAKRRRQKVASASDDNTAGNETAEGRRYILFLGELRDSVLSHLLS